VFTPVILASTFGHERQHATAVVDIVHNEMLAAKGSALIDTLLLVGVLAAVFLSDSLGRIRLQIIGFIGCAAGFAIAALSGAFAGTLSIVLVFAGFMVFNFMTAMGPNAQTYLIAGEVFPTEVRGIGAGFAASFGKAGAVLTTFLFPILLISIGTDTLLAILVGTSLLGAAVTLVFPNRDRR